jgi:flagellar hook-length control protein FliK
MSTPINPSGFNASSLTASSNGAAKTTGGSGSPALNDLMARLNGQQAGAVAPGTQQAFSQWLDKHAVSPQQDAPKPAAKAAEAPHKPAASQAPKLSQAPAHLSTEQLQASQSQARQTLQTQQANRADKAPKPVAKAPAKDGSAKAEHEPDAEAKAASDEDETETSTTPSADGAALVRELTPPTHLQPGDATGMMAWLARLSQTEVQLDQGGAGAELAGDAAGQGAAQLTGQSESASRPGQGLLEHDPSQLAHGFSLDNPAWRSASGSATAALQADALLAPTGAAGDSPADTTALASMLAGGLPGAAGSANRSEAATLRHETATLATPFGGTDFAQALAEKVSLWVSSAQTSGPMTAELHLNPADMGPINVKISLDGQSAQVDFAAAALETRQAIEASMPMLSTALDSIGLSLTGGDVSSQTSQQSFAQQMAENDARRAGGRAGREGLEVDGREADGAGVRQVSVPRPGRAGGLDLYA